MGHIPASTCQECHTGVLTVFSLPEKVCCIPRVPLPGVVAGQVGSMGAGYSQLVHIHLTLLHNVKLFSSNILNYPN